MLLCPKTHLACTAGGARMKVECTFLAFKAKARSSECTSPSFDCVRDGGQSVGMCRMT